MITEESFQKQRSAAGCIAEASRMLTDNYKSLFRKLWLPALVYSVFFALYMVVWLYNFPPHYTEQVTHTTIIGLFAVIVLMAATIYFQASILTVLNKSSLKNNLLRMLKITLLVLVIVNVIVGIIMLIEMALLHSFKAGAVFLLVNFVLLILIFILYVPLEYCIVKYLLQTTTKLFKHFTKNYRIGLRHMGFLVGCLLLVVLITMIVMSVVSLPAILIGVSKVISATGEAFGDPDGLPSTFPYFAFLAFFFTGIVCSVFYIWGFLVAALAVGSIDVAEAERDKES